MNINKIKVIVSIALLVLYSATYAYKREVPSFYPTIQQGILAANNGDTVSVWVHTVPPDTYYDNINFLGKNILVVNRSYIENTGYPPNPNDIVIDGQQKGSVVTFNHNENHDAILKGFTIRT